MDNLTFEQFCRRYDREVDCIEAWAKLKWPAGFQCPKCRGTHAYLIRTRRLPLYECRNCRHQTSPISGTILEGSRVPLRLWFRALYLHAQPSGVSAVKLAQIIGVTYKTAWLMGHKIRYAMGRKDEKNRLIGLVRITPARYGRAYNPTVFRHPREHPLLIGATLGHDGQARYVKMKQVASEDIPYRNAEHAAVRKFCNLHVQCPSSEIISDVCRPISERSKMLLHYGKAAGKWLNAVFRGIGPKHLQAYLDQYCFTLNCQLGKEFWIHQCFACCAREKRITLRALVSRPAHAPSTPHYDRIMQSRRLNRKNRSIA